MINASAYHYICNYAVVKPERFCIEHLHESFCVLVRASAALSVEVFTRCIASVASFAS